jgi:molybdenum cofactor biosynthesis enzyme MoaA
MSEKTLKWQRELLRDAMSTLGDVKIDEPMKRGDFAHLVSAIMQLEEVRDIALTTNEDEKTKIMNKWQ